MTVNGRHHFLYCNSWINQIVCCNYNMDIFYSPMSESRLNGTAGKSNNYDMGFAENANEMQSCSVYIV